MGMQGLKPPSNGMALRKTEGRWVKRGRERQTDRKTETELERGREGKRDTKRGRERERDV